MMTFNDCKEEVAKKHGFDCFNDILIELYCQMCHMSDVDNIINEASEMYATEIAKAQREACAENATIKQESEYIDCSTGYAIVSRVDEDSILSTPLVTDKPR